MDEFDPTTGSLAPLGSGSATHLPRVETGDLYSRIGDYGQALHTYLTLWQRLPDRRELALGRRIAYCLERLGRYQEALEHLSPLLVEAPLPDLLEEGEREELGRCHLVLGKCYLEAGRLEESRAEGERAADCFGDRALPEGGFAQNLLGTIAYRTGDIEQAQSHFQRALGRFRALGDVTSLSLAYMNLGHVYKQRGEWDRALEHYHAAYYLRATEGEYQELGALHQNLGLVLLRVGRFDEALERLEKSLASALELGDPVRALRARLALARLERECLRLASAREHLKACRQSSPDPKPEREHCLLLLEEAHLAHALEQPEVANDLLRELKERVERMAARGDLMVEALLLEGALVLDRGEWETARVVYQRADTLAREDRDRFQESRALEGKLRLAAATGHLDETDRIFRVLEERHRFGQERPSLALLYEWRGNFERDVRRDREAALKWHTRARGSWRQMGRSLREARVEILMADHLLAMGQQGEAAAMVETVQSRLDGVESSEFQIAGPLQRITEMLARECERETGVLDGERVLKRLEEILSWEAEPAEKMRGAIRLLGEALEADGALLARVQGESLEVVTSLSMGRLGGRRLVPVKLLGLSSTDRPAVLESSKALAADLDQDEESPIQSSALCLPGSLFGRDHLLYVERRGRARLRFTRSDLNYALVLFAEILRGLPRDLPETAAEGVPRNLEQLRHGIYVADIITQDSHMLSILALIHKVSASELTVLLQGETGTGKKLLAHAIHRVSDRRARPFVTVDCAALPDSILESELFGHRKGAFTGAMQDRIGLLEEANGGTIFLDEIDKCGLAVQRRFLHLLDSGEIRPVGSTGYRSLDVRVVCATSCPDIRAEVAEGRFLKDLYYRLNDISIQIPPLRERPDDVPLLADCFIDRFAQQLHREIRGVAPAFYDALQSHPWPGNVRELEKAIRRAVTLVEDGGLLSSPLLPSAVLESTGRDGGPQGGALRLRLEGYERQILLECLERHHWNKSRSAAELGLSRKGLKGKIARFHLDRRRRP